MPTIQERLNRLNEIGAQSERIVSGSTGVLPQTSSGSSIQERLNRLSTIGKRSEQIIAGMKPASSIGGVSKEQFSEAKTPLLLGYDERADDYDGLFGTLRGVGESALAGIRSANEALAGWLADVTPDAVKENISLVDVDQDAARAAASAASGAVQERFGRTEESQEQGRERQQQATDYLTQRRNELDTGVDIERLFEEAANSQAEAARIREYTVGDSGAFAQLLFDAGVGGVQLGYDALINMLVPGSGLASAGLRGAGSGILEAQQSGASTLEQLAYGLGVGAIEAATEKISNLAGPLRRVFGGGVADRAVSSLVNRLTSSTAGRAVLNLAANAAGEGFEEFVSSAANPVLRRIFDENALAEYGDPQMWADAAYDALVGATIGGVLGGAGQVIENRANRRASQNAAEAPTAGTATQTGVDTSAGANPAEAGIDAQTPNNTASEDGSLISANENQQETTSDGRASQTGTVDTVSSPAGNSSISPAGANVNALADSMTDEQLALEQQRIREQYAALNQPAAQTSQNGEVSATDSLGAAPAGFDTYSAALERYGEMPERGTGAREVSIPRAMNDDSVVPQTVQTFANAGATPETTYTDITRLLEQGGFNRAVITDRASLGRAEQTITDKGFQQALVDWTATVRSGRVSKDTTTLGLTLYNNAINSGDTQTGIQILTDIVDNARTAAQATQAMSILNKLTPEGRLYGVQRSIANLQDELNTKYGDLAPNLHIDDSLAGDYLNATDEQTRFEILDQIYQDIANQVPQNWYDKLNAWRYFAMLANPRTHVKNVLGNSAMAGLTSIRNRISSGLQRRFVSDRSQRTRETISRRNSAEDVARYQVGMQEYKRINDMLGDAGKYTNELNRIRRHMRAPFNGVLGKAVDFASNTLEAEDIFFSQKAYASNLAQFLRARGITAEDYVSGNAGQEVIAEAQAYAIREAQRLTFRDFNTFSNFVQRIANLGGDSAAGRVWQTIVGANIPFTRTPANIVVRGVEYSPIGLARGLYNLGVNVKRGNMTAGEAIDQISSGLIGTALVGLGALLASQGVITGGGSDDEEQAAFDELRGFQPYALQIGGNSYTLDWLAPAALPFFTGAEIWNQLAGSGSEDEETNALEAVLQGIGHMTDPMLEMSMLSGISDLLDSVAYYQGSNSIWPVLSSSVTNYISQFFPSVFGAIERTIEDTRQSSYTDPTSIIPDDLQYPISQAMNRLPGEYNQVDYIDAWGRTESTGSLAGRAASNFVSPGYYSRLSESEVEDELQRVYDATGGEYNVFPDRATMGNTTINGERLTPEQYTEYATTLGQTRLAEVSALMETDAYKAMSDAEKARAIQEVYDYALQTAKHAIDPSYEVDSRYEKAAEYGDIAEYLAFDRAWSSVEDSKGANTAAFEAVMQDYERMSTQKQNALMDALGENSRFDDVVDAYEAGIDPERWYDAYDEWRAIDGGEGSATDKATQFAQWLETKGGYSENESNLLQDQLAYYSMIRGSAERYDELRGFGFSPQESYDLYEAIGEMNTFKADKDENGKSISGSKKAKVIAFIDALNLTPAEKDILFNEFTTYTGLEDTPWH